MQLKGAAPAAGMAYVKNDELLSNGYYKQKWFSFMPHADLMVDMANLFGKYKKIEYIILLLREVRDS